MVYGSLLGLFIIWHDLSFKQTRSLELLLEYSLAYLITFILVITFGKVYFSLGIGEGTFKMCGYFMVV